MSADYYATTIVGVRVPAKKLHAEKTVKAFKHNHPPDWMVDPKTGKSLWKTEETFLLEGMVCDAYDWLDARHGADMRKEAKAAITYSQEDSDGRGEYAFIGRRLARIHVGHTRDEGGFKKIDADLLAEKKFLEDLLTPVGLWDERAFGIWLVGDVSC